MKPWARLAISAYLVIHLVTMSVAAFRKTPYGALLHPITDPWQWTVGMHQNWDMFVPDAPVRAVSLEAEGIRDDGSRAPIALPRDPPRADGAHVFYDRGAKLVRNASHDEDLRASFVRWACRAHADAGDPLARVAFTRVTVVTPPPGVRAERPRDTWKVKREELETWRCKR